MARKGSGMFCGPLWSEHRRSSDDGRSFFKLCHVYVPKPFLLQTSLASPVAVNSQSREFTWFSAYVYKVFSGEFMKQLLGDFFEHNVGLTNVLCQCRFFMCILQLQVEHLKAEEGDLWQLKVVQSAKYDAMLLFASPVRWNRLTMRQPGAKNCSACFTHICSGCGKAPRLRRDHSETALSALCLPPIAR